MTHVDEKNWALVQFDILTRELITSSFTEYTEVILISPWFKDYEMPTTWPSFASNFIDITETQRFGDIIKSLRKNDVTVKLVCEPIEDLGWDDTNKRESREFIQQMNDVGVEIYYNRVNHGKQTSTTNHVLFGSGNTTRKGTQKPSKTVEQQSNVGHLFVKSTDPRDYKDKIEWGYDSVLAESKHVTTSDQIQSKWNELGDDLIPSASIITSCKVRYGIK